MPIQLSKVLARNRAAQIEYCADCDVLHMTVGPVTLRLQTKAAHLLCSALVEALERLPATQRPTMSLLPTHSELSS
ncbi:MAG: hypothetical protein AAGF11_21390 [Myxococcota bacterium]